MNLTRWISWQRRRQNQRQSRRLRFEGLEGRQLLATSSLWGAVSSGSPAILILEIVVEFRGGNFSPNSCPRSVAHLAQ